MIWEPNGDWLNGYLKLLVIKDDLNSVKVLYLWLWPKYIIEMTILLLQDKKIGCIFNVIKIERMVYSCKSAALQLLSCKSSSSITTKLLFICLLSVENKLYFSIKKSFKRYHFSLGLLHTVQFLLCTEIGYFSIWEALSCVAIVAIIPHWPITLGHNTQTTCHPKALEHFNI